MNVLIIAVATLVLVAVVSWGAYRIICHFIDDDWDEFFEPWRRLY